MAEHSLAWQTARMARWVARLASNSSKRGKRIYAHYSGDDVVDGHLVGTFDGSEWDIRYSQINSSQETAIGHSVGTVELLEDGRVRVGGE